MNRRSFMRRLMILTGLAILSPRHSLDYISQSYKPKKKWKHGEYMEIKKRMLEAHAREIERAFLFGVKS